MVDLGYFALCLALVTGGYSTAACVAGAVREEEQLVHSGENAAITLFALLSLSLIGLWYALFTHDFHVQYVAENSNRAMSRFYTATALWGGQNGSLLFWGWILSAYTTATVLFNRRRHRDLMPWVVAVLAASCSFFILLNLFAADPFLRLPVAPDDGRGLNPILQHPVMAIHPPMLYLGMVGMAVPFAFAVAALITGQLGHGWIMATRRWMLIPWTFLGAGLLLGGKWAYVELGWGGYWGWDPVENSSLMPWLAATAFLHSIMVQERKGMLKIWNMVLVIFTYFLCIFGTFITRSGVISSVHAFAQSDVGPYFVALLVLLAFGSSMLLWQRRADLIAENRLEAFASRETAFMLNNWILLGMLFSVLWGTTFPLLSEAISDQQITVSAVFFNQVNIPIGLVLIFLTGAGPLFAWRRTSLHKLKRAFAIPVSVGILATLISLACGIRHLYALMSLTLCAFTATAVLSEFHRGARARQRHSGERYVLALYRLCTRNRRRFGGYMVHLSLILLFTGFTGQAFTYEQEVVLDVGESAQILEYTATFDGLGHNEDANRTATAAAIRLERGGVFLATLLPARHHYASFDQGTTEVAIYSRLKEDFYIILVGWTENGSAKFKTYINPLVNCVWAGGIVFVLGSLWCMWPSSGRERENATAEITEPTPTSPKIHA